MDDLDFITLVGSTVLFFILSIKVFAFVHVIESNESGKTSAHFHQQRLHPPIADIRLDHFVGKAFANGRPDTLPCRSRQSGAPDYTT